MTDQTLSEFLTEKLVEYDPDLDTSSGSRFDREVLQPLLTRLGDSPLDVDLTQLVQDTVEQEDSDVLVRPGSALHDLLVRFLATSFAPLKRELELGRVSASLVNAASLTRDELDARMGNYFLSLSEGRKSAAVFRVEYRSPHAVSVTPLSEFKVGALKYYPTTVQSLTASAMGFNRTSGGRYYFDVSVEAEEAGSDYDLAVGQSVSSVELTDAERITVSELSTRGVDAETVDEAVARTQESITQRNLSTAAGIRLVLKDASNFPELGNIVVVGFGDDEMDRDVVVGPAAISDIPGGILGTSPPDVGVGEQVHIGGKTDIYIQGALSSYTIDIDNPANTGRLLFESTTGYTLAAADGGVNQLHDDSVPFDLLLRDQPGFEAGGLDSYGSGFYLLIGGDEFAVQALDRQYLQVYTDAAGDKPVAYAPAGVGELDPSGVAIRSDTDLVELVASLTAQPYAVYYRDFHGDDSSYGHARGYVADVPLWSLVAMEDGAAVLDDNGDPVAPIPGSPTLGPLQDTGGDPIPKSEVYAIEDPEDVGVLQTSPNVAGANVQLPLAYVNKVELLDPLTDEVLSSVPHGAPLRVVLQDEVAPGGYGTARCWFESAVSAAVFRDRHAVSVLHYGEDKLFPRPLVAYSGATPAGVGSGSWLDGYEFVEADGDVKSVYRVEVTGSSAVLAVVDEAGAPVSVPGTAQGLYRAIQPGDRLIYWREDDYTGAVVCTVKAVNAGSIEVYWPSTSSPPEASGWADDYSDFAVVQGSLAAGAALDEDSGYYYVDFDYEAPLSNAGTVPRDSELTWLAAADLDNYDSAIPVAVQSPLRVEGWVCQPHSSKLSYSSYERPHLRLTWQVNDEDFLFDPRGLGTSVGAARLRVTYQASTSLADVEAFVRDDANRIVAEELLVRHLPPALVSTHLSYEGGESEATTLAAVQEFLEAANPEEGLEVSDLVKVVDDLGATYVAMPVTLQVRWLDRDRVRRLEVVTDRRSLNRLLQTYADEDRLTTTKLD
jgi:hypothetical protein